MSANNVTDTPIWFSQDIIDLHNFYLTLLWSSLDLLLQIATVVTKALSFQWVPCNKPSLCSISNCGLNYVYLESILSCLLWDSYTFILIFDSVAKKKCKNAQQILEGTRIFQMRFRNLDKSDRKILMKCFLAHLYNSASSYATRPISIQAITMFIPIIRFVTQLTQLQKSLKDV